MTKPAELYACVYAKEFPAQAMLRLRTELRDKPCAVLQGEPPMQQVCSCNAKARILGVQRSMTRVEMDTFPSVSVLPRSRPEEESATAAMLECAGTFSPSVEVLSSDDALLCMIDVAGTERLHGPPLTLGHALVERVRLLGITCSVAIAGNFHVALCMARGMASKSRVTVVPRGDEAAALSPLPVSVLDLPEEQAETFSLWGIHTLGMLAALPETALIARMGQAGRRLRQLASGTLPHLFVPVEATFALEEFMELDSPVELLESLLFVVGAMLEQLIIRATNRVLALASITIVLSLEGGDSHSRTVRPALPSNDRQLWVKLLHLDLEAHPPAAAILSLRLSAEPGRTSKVQLGLFSPQLPEPSRLDITLARIRAIVGEECVGSPVLKDSHRLDDFQMKPFIVHAAGITAPEPERSMAAPRQLRPAEEISVTLRDQRPALFFFRQRRYEVDRVYGPWVTGGEWWNERRWGLQQWDAVARCNDGTLLCCCLNRDLTRHRWYMAALYD